MSFERYRYLPPEERLSYLTKHDARKSRFGRKGIKINDHGTKGNPAGDGNSLSGPELDKWKSEKAKYWRASTKHIPKDISDRKYEEMMLDEVRDWCDEEDWEALMALDPNQYDPSKDFNSPVRRGIDPSIPWFGRTKPEVGRFGTSDRRGSRKVRPDSYVQYWYSKNGNI